MPMYLQMTPSLPDGWHPGLYAVAAPFHRAGRMRLHISILLVGILLHGAAGAEALDGLSPPTHQIQVLADTRIEDPPVFSGATSAPLPGPGERIELQVFIPAAAGKEAYGYIVEFDDADGAFSRAFTISDAYTWAVAQVYDQTGWRRIARRIDMPGPVGSAGPGRSILFANSPIVPASGLIATLVLDVNGTVARNRPLRFTASAAVHATTPPTRIWHFRAEQTVFWR